MPGLRNVLGASFPGLLESALLPAPEEVPAEPGAVTDKADSLQQVGALCS